jgi:hypothetical protein
MSAELKNIQKATKEYLEFLNKGEFERARTVANFLVSSTYTLDAVWVEARKKVDAL